MTLKISLTRTIAWSALACAAMAPRLPAQPPTETTTLTLEQATAYALEHSPLLAIVQTGVDNSVAQIEEALSYFYPTIGIQGSYAYLSSVPVLKVQVGPGQYLSMPLGSHANYDARLSLSQTLYAGGRIGKAAEMARLGLAVNQDSLARKKQGLTYSVRSAFDNVLLLKEMLKLTRQSQELARDHLKVVKALQDQGFVSSYDLLRTSVQVDNLTPQIERIESGIRLSIEGLKLTIGMPLTESLDVAGELTANLTDYSIDEASGDALANRRELKMLDEAIRVTRLGRDLVAANYLPAIGAGVAYDLKNPSSMGSSGWGTSLTASLGLSYTLFDGLRTRAQLRQADASIRQLLITRDLLKDAVTLEVKEAVISMQAARASLAAAAGNVAAADSSVKLSATRYATGQGSNLDVLDSQLALLQAQVNEAQARKDYDDAQARLIKAIGKEE